MSAVAMTAEKMIEKSDESLVFLMAVKLVEMMVG